MLKRILGEAPYDVFLDGSALVVPYKRTELTLVFVSKTEYDLPLSCFFRLSGSIKTDICEFDVVLPAEGKTKQQIVLTLQEDAKIVGGESLAELEIIDRLLDSKTVYELELMGEMAYMCVKDKNVSFFPSDGAVYTRNGRFFGNRGEYISLEIPVMEQTETELSVISGKITDLSDGHKIVLTPGINRILLKMEEDTSFELVNPSGGQTVFLKTVNPEFFI